MMLSSPADEPGQFVETLEIERRHTRKAVRRRADAVDPCHLEPEALSGMGITAVRRYEADVLRARQFQRLLGVEVPPSRRCVDAENLERANTYNALGIVC